MSPNSAENLIQQNLNLMKQIDVMDKEEKRYKEEERRYKEEQREEERRYREEEREDERRYREEERKRMRGEILELKNTQIKLLEIISKKIN